MTSGPITLREESSGKSPTDAVKQASPRSRKRGGFQKLRADDGDGEAKRLAAVVLEVLAGGRTPTEAAEVLGVSPPRYYALEQRALDGLLAACRRRQRGRAKTPQRELEKLKGDVRRLERECGRWQALLRAAQRTVGIAPPKPVKSEPGRKRRPRRSRVARALRAAGALRNESKGKPVNEPLEKGGEKGEDGALKTM
jgi:hypothetical protein